MPLTQAYTQSLLNHAFMKTALVQPANVFVGLSSTTPTRTGGNVTEPSGGGYARASTAAAAWATAVAGTPSSLTNATVITLPTATADWLAAANLTHFVLYSVVTGGTGAQIIGYGALDVPKGVASGDTASFAAGALTTKLGDPADTY